MKLFFYVFVFCLMLTQCVKAQSTYKLNIKPKNDIYLIGSMPMENRDCLTAGYDFYGSTNTVLRLVRINSMGKTVWSKQFFVPGYYAYDGCFAPTKDNGFIAVARLDSGSRYGKALEIFKCDSSGNIQWQKKIFPEGKSGIYPDKIIQKKDGSYYFVYDENSFTALSKLDANGDVIWIKGFDATVTDYGYNIRDLREADDGGALISISDIACEFYCAQFKIYKFSSSGNPEAELKFDPDFSFSSDVSYMNQDLTGRYIILFKGWILRAPEGKYSFMTIPADSNIANTLTFNDNIFSVQYLLRTGKIPGARKLLTSRNGFLENYTYFNKDLSINTTAENYSANNKKYLSVEKYDSLGRICTDFTNPPIDSVINQTQISLYKDIFKLKNITGLVYQNSNLLSPDVNSNALVCIGKAHELVNEKAGNYFNSTQNKNGITVFPNPAHNFISVSINSKINSSTSFQITSINGAVKQEYFATANNQSTQNLNISNLQKGMYFLKVKTNNAEQVFKFLKE